jgi:hypothetical protein
MSELDTVRAWRRLMLRDDGTLTPDAEVVMRDLEAVCGWMVSALPVDNAGRVDPYQTAAGVVRRGVYAHVKRRVFGPIDALLKKEAR